MAPAPVTPVPKLNVTGPLPEFPASDVQSKLSVGLNPDPVQLQGEAAHTTEITLFAPAKMPATVTPPTEVALKLGPRRVASAPNCDQSTKSFADELSASMFRRDGIPDYVKSPHFRRGNAQGGRATAVDKCVLHLRRRVGNPVAVVSTIV